MIQPDKLTEVYLQPGDFFFGGPSARIRTVLGSCVSITMWHPIRLIGGMCHYMLPGRARKNSELQGKYADEAIEMFLREAARYKTSPAEYQIKLFGGGNMFPKQTADPNESISSRNVRAAELLLARHNLDLTSRHVGMSGHRHIIFEVWSGHVWVRHQSINE